MCLFENHGTCDVKYYVINIERVRGKERICKYTRMVYRNEYLNIDMRVRNKERSVFSKIVVRGKWGENEKSD